MEALIQELQNEITANDAKIQKEERANQELEEKLTVMDKEKDDYKEKIEALQQDFLKERDEPNRLAKINENKKKEVEHVSSDLEKLQSENKTVD